MTRATAFVLIQVTMLATLTGVFLGLSSIGAQSDAFVLAFIVIGGSAAFAISETVAHYAKRDESQRRRSHKPPASG